MASSPGGPGEGRRGSAARSAEAGWRQENLALLYQGFLTGIVRIQSGRQEILDSTAFRKRMKDSLREAEREASKRGYHSEEVKEATFAIIAFLDEAVLTSADPSRTQWAKQSLQEELFGQAMGGELFFERLEKTWARPDSPQVADLLEVYYLCLSLGYEGRYAVGPKAELNMLIDNLRDRIERISPRGEALSPEGRLPSEPARAPGVDTLTQELRWFALAALAVTALSFGLFWTHLYWRSAQVLEVIERASGRP